MTTALTAARYEAKSAIDDGIGIYTLRDTTTDVVVRIAPTLGALFAIPLHRILHPPTPSTPPQHIP